MDMSLGKLLEIVMGREAWGAEVSGVVKSRTRLQQQNPYAEVLTPVPQNVTLFGDEVFWVVPIQNDCCSYEQASLGTDTSTNGKCQVKIKAEMSDAYTCMTMPKIAKKPPEARWEAGNQSSLTVLGRNQPWAYLDLGIMSRTVRQGLSVV